MNPSEASKKIEFHSKQICHGCVHPSMVGWCENHCQLPEAFKMAISALKKQEQDRWIQVTERLPEECEEVNITWINTEPAVYYEDIKNKPFTGTGLYCHGRWYWYSAVCKDYLEERGMSPCDEMDDAIKVTAWRPLPEPYKLEEES